ncbi:MAG TPA: lyase family protein, partial [Gemmatimonadaceae bacterium]|nr:lyase family protein [Gemmatimonadaceae bacterium]
MTESRTRRSSTKSVRPPADLLATTAFFRGLPGPDLEYLAARMTPASYAPDTLLFREGDPRQLLAVIVSGSVAIAKDEGRGRESRLVTLGAGEIVGEGLLLDDSGHATTARVLEAAEVLVLGAKEVKALLTERPQLFAALVARAARSISQRLRSADATLVGRGRPMGFAGAATRMEHDLLGDREVPDEALYGVQTLRALENFPITGTPLREFPELIVALGAVKEAAALANEELGLLAPETAQLIVQAAREVRAGRHHEHFLVDMIQGGAGTSTNMNANEVIANRSLELAGKQRGDYKAVHPNNHVNLSQSTNDVYPTAVKLALHASLDGLRGAIKDLAAAFLMKGDEFSQLIKMGRTQLQDAVPMTLGQEFTAFGHTLLEDVERLGEVQALIREIN